MKCIVIVCALVCLAGAKVLPDRLDDLVCAKSVPDYSKCLLENLEKARPYFVKGIPELNQPPMDPFTLPLMTVDRTVNDLVSIKAVLKNINIQGMSDLTVQRLKANPFNQTGEFGVSFPWSHLEMDYDVNGQLLVVPLRSKGFFEGNFTDTQIFVKGSMKTVDKNGVKYFRVDKLQSKIRVGDGHVKLTAANPALQFGATLIANFYNQNPRLVMDAINPIVVHYSNEMYRTVLDQILSTTPAKELLPE